MQGATNAAKVPEVAPDGIVILIGVTLQEFTVTCLPFSIAVLLPRDAPKPVPKTPLGSLWVPHR